MRSYQRGNIGFRIFCLSWSLKARSKPVLNTRKAVVPFFIKFLIELFLPPNINNI